jgi:transcription initiation factor IIE alpha subunit
MSDTTVYAEALIATVARAFYDDEAVAVIDVLLRDKYLRDDDMGPRLSLPAKQLRRTLQFLAEEHIVKFELVNDLDWGGSQTTKFWFIDYNHAVKTIRLRLHLLRKQLEQAELDARSNSFYLCPGYKEKRCNGRYTETEAQQVVDPNTGLFLCQECVQTYEADPNPPPVKTYTLHLVDNTKELKLAVDNLRRFQVQLSGKMIGNTHLRASIYDLLHKIRSGKQKGPLSSNLPSENFSLGIGSKRLAGTGRTAGIKAKKMEQQGVILSGEDSDLTFLKNAIGQEVAFTVEKGGGARANLLATNKRRRRKLMEAAASRIGADLPLYVKMAREKRKQQEQVEAEHARKRQKGEDPSGGLSFLKNNIGRTKREEELEKARLKELSRLQQEGSDVVLVDEDNGTFVFDDLEEFQKLTEEERRAVFQAQYKVEMERQIQLLGLTPEKTGGRSSLADDSMDESSISWEDG